MEYTRQFYVHVFYHQRQSSALQNEVRMVWNILEIGCLFSELLLMTLSSAVYRHCSNNSIKRTTQKSRSHVLVIAL